MTRAKGPSPYKVYLCGGVTDCPNDPAFEHDSYYGCVPKDFSTTTGRSKTHKQTRGVDGRCRWNGGCDTAPSDSTGNVTNASTDSRQLGAGLFAYSNERRTVRITTLADTTTELRGAS